MDGVQFIAIVITITNMMSMHIQFQYNISPVIKLKSAV